MGETSPKIGHTQVNQLINRFCDTKNNQPYGPARRNKLGSELVDNNVLREEIWESMKTERDTAKFWSLMHNKLERNQQTYEVIMEWMNNSDDVRAAKSFRAKEISMAEEILSSKSESIGATSDDFEAFGFEVAGQSQFIFDALSTFINLEKYGMTKTSDIKLRVRKYWEQEKKYYENYSKVQESSISWIFHSASDMFRRVIHVICLLTMEEVCFYPMTNISKSLHIYLGRSHSGKYISLRKRDSDELYSSDFDEESEVERLRIDVELLTIQLDEAKKEAETYKRKIDELEQERRGVEGGSPGDTLQTPEAMYNMDMKIKELDLKYRAKINEIKNKDARIRFLTNQLIVAKKQAAQLSDEVKEQKQETSKAKGELQVLHKQKKENIEKMKNMQRELEEMITSSLSCGQIDSENYETQTETQVKAEIGIHIQVNDGDKSKKQPKNRGKKNKKNKE